MNSKIRNAMRENEAAVLEHLREAIRRGEPVSYLAMFGTAWHKALDRLLKAKKVKIVRQRGPYANCHYIPVRGARPVTKRVK